MKTEARDYMIAYRESKGMSIKEMAQKCQISEILLRKLEGDDTCVTHPNIVQRVAKAYKLTKAQRTAMLPPNHRPGPNYNPDLYKEAPEDPRDFRIMPSEKRGFYGSY